MRSNGAGFTQRRSVACRIRLKSAPRSNRVTLLQTKVTVGFAARRATALPVQYSLHVNVHVQGVPGVPGVTITV